MRRFLFVPILILGSLLGAQEWYRSNSMGVPLEPIGWYRQREYEWVLKREVQGDSDTLTLLNLGAEVDRWERLLYPSSGSPRSITYFQKGRKDHALLFDPLGRMTQEQVFEDQKLLQYYEYNYLGNLLSEVKLVEGSGKLLYTDTFKRTPQGRLRQLIRQFADHKIETRWVYGQSGMVQEWHRDGDSSLRRSFTEQGQPLSDQKYLEGELRESRSWEYRDWVLYRFVEKTTLLGERVRKTFDPEGRVVLEEFFVNDKFAGEVRYRYEKDLLVFRDRVAPGLRERWERDFDEQGSLVKESYFHQNLLSKETYFENGLRNREDLYVGGEKVLEILFEGEEKVREIFYSGGQVLRERDLRSDN